MTTPDGDQEATEVSLASPWTTSFVMIIIIINKVKLGESTVGDLGIRVELHPTNS